jgi:hypothetical protein
MPENRCLGAIPDWVGRLKKMGKIAIKNIFNFEVFSFGHYLVNVIHESKSS